MLEENIRAFTLRIEELSKSISTEEATKTSLIMPFFAMLGYDVFNPMEFIPEFTADVGIKKGEKVDYAICTNGEPLILIEAKSVNEKLEKHDSQLFRYFGTSKAKFAILTNGIIYKFYTDLDNVNVMDTTPFLSINLLAIKDSDIMELKKFEKNEFDISKILDTASDLKYTGQIKEILKDEFNNPSDDMVRMLLNKGVYEFSKTQTIIEKYRPIVKKSIMQYLSDLVNDKIQSALKVDSVVQTTEVPESINTEVEVETEDKHNEIVTTEDELQGYYIIKSILGQTLDINRISYKDTISYFSVLLDKKVTKWIARIHIKEFTRYLIIPKENNNNKYVFENIEDIYNYSQELIDRANELLG